MLLIYKNCLFTFVTECVFEFRCWMSWPCYWYGNINYIAVQQTTYVRKEIVYFIIKLLISRRHRKQHFFLRKMLKNMCSNNRVNKLIKIDCISMAKNWKIISSDNWQSFAWFNIRMSLGYDTSMIQAYRICSTSKHHWLSIYRCHQ